VTAHVIYRDTRGNEITDLSNGVWLENRGPETIFDAGKKRCLIVLLTGKDNKFLLKIWKDIEDTRWGGSIYTRHELRSI
jgi:hypothetical protein